MTVVADLWGDAHGPGRRGLLLDVAAGAAFAAGFGLLQLQLLPWTPLAAVLLGAAIAVRRVAPVAMVVLATAASLLQVVTGNVAFVASLGYVPLFATLGGHRDARYRRLGLVCGVVAVAVASAFAWARVDDGQPTQDRVVGALALGAPAAVLLLGGWAVGYLRWQRRQAVQARADATVQLVERRRLSDLFEQEQERGRIAADMHDLVAHSWAVVAAQADGARYVVRADPDRAADALAVIGDTARSAMDDVRVLLAQLRERPGTGDPLAFERPDALADRMRAAGMDLRVERHDGPPPPALLELTARRVLTESLTNALKHGDLTQPVEVVEDWRAGYRLRVANAVSAQETGTEGHGLRGMAERMAVVGGTLRAGRQGDRWVVEAAAW